MSRSYPVVPWVPAMGHIVRGNWHYGRVETCQKSPCREDREEREGKPKPKPRLDFGRMPRQRSTNAEDQ